MSVTRDRSVDFFGYSGFLHQSNCPPRYIWNIVESDVKHHSSNSHPYAYNINTISSVASSLVFNTLCAQQSFFYSLCLCTIYYVNGHCGQWVSLAKLRFYIWQRPSVSRRLHIWYIMVKVSVSFITILFGGLYIYIYMSYRKHLHDRIFSVY